MFDFEALYMHFKGSPVDSKDACWLLGDEKDMLRQKVKLLDDEARLLPQKIELLENIVFQRN